MTEVLTALQLRRLTEHKYSAGGTSLAEPLMQKFWRWLVEQIPLWWAPNAITLAGLLMNVVSTLILVYYSPDGKSEVSSFVVMTNQSADGLQVDGQVISSVVDLAYFLA